MHIHIINKYFYNFILMLTTNNQNQVGMYQNLVKGLRTTEKKKTRLLPANILTNITTTTYEKVICYLKELKSYFGGSTTTTFYNIPQDKKNETKDSSDEKKKFVEKIEFIISSIQAQNLYDYSNNDEIENDGEGEDDIQSLIGFLNSYSNIDNRRNVKYPTTKGPIKLNNKLLVTKNQNDEINKNTDKLELKSFISFQPNNNPDKLMDKSNEEAFAKEKKLESETKILDTREGAVYQINVNPPSINAGNLLASSREGDNNNYNTNKLGSNLNLFHFDSKVGENANDEVTINKSEFMSENNYLDVSNINYDPLVTNIPMQTAVFDNKFNEPTHEILSKNFNIFKYSDKIGEDNVMSTIFKFGLENIDRYVKFPHDAPKVGELSKNTYHYSDTVASLIDFTKVHPFATFVREKYNKNPYHNHLHGTDVFHQLFQIFVHSPIIYWARLKAIDVTAALIAGLVHDIGHPGFNNNFMINSKSDLTITYNDLHVLENFHAAEGFKILSKSNTNFLNKLGEPEIKYLRKRFIQMILSTDPVSHSKIVSLVKNKLASFEVVEGKNIENLVSENREYDDQQEILDFIISFSDTAHSCKDYEVTFNWTSRLMNEFWHQGDVEKELDLPISFLCERKDAYVGKGQIGFIQAIILPGATTLVTMCPSLDYLTKNLNDNISKWQEYLDNREKELAQDQKN